MNRLVLGLILVAGTHSACSAVAAPPLSTFCNPVADPRLSPRRAGAGRDQRRAAGRRCPLAADHKEQFRELADPTAVWHDGKWYLYPSVDMAWVSADNGATWQHHPLNIRDVGYAPTVVKHRRTILPDGLGLAALRVGFAAWAVCALGRIQVPRVAGMPGFSDPMLFSDEDGRLFFYWGCTRTGGIWGVELDASDPTNAITRPVELIPFQPATQPWEALGDWNQDPTAGWVEGSWMLKRDGNYFLTYSAAGTQNRTYAMGCYTAPSPLGPFAPQKRNPFFRSIRWLGHRHRARLHRCRAGGPAMDVLYDPGGVVHGFERRLGMDRVEMDANGELFVPLGNFAAAMAAGQSPRRKIGRYRLAADQRRTTHGRLDDSAEFAGPFRGGQRHAHLVAAGRG